MVEDLGTSSATDPGKILNVQLLETDRKVNWKQDPAGLSIQLPSQYRADNNYAAELKLSVV